MVCTIIPDRGMVLILYEYFTLPECRQCANIHSPNRGRPRLNGPCPRLESVHSYICPRLSPYKRNHTRAHARTCTRTHAHTHTHTHLIG